MKIKISSNTKYIDSSNAQSIVKDRQSNHSSDVLKKKKKISELLILLL